MSESRVSEYREEIVNGPIVRTFFRLGIPPLINQLIAVAYNVLDALWLSIYNDLAVSVPRQVWPVIFLFNAPMQALTTVGMSTISQYIGMKDYREAEISASKLLTMASSLGIFLSISLFSLRSFIFSQVIGTPEEIAGWVMDYSAIMSVNILLNYIVFSYNTVLQAIGDTKRPAIINAFAVSVNTVLDPFLVLGIPPFPRTGVIGAALTDVLGSIISLVLLSSLLRKYELRMGFTSLGWDWIKLSIKIGFPVFIMASMNSLAFIAQLRLVNAFSIVAVTAYSIGFVVADIADAALFGLVSASSIMIGQNLGAGNLNRAKEISLKAAASVFSLLVLGILLVYPLRIGIVRAFTEDASIIGETDKFLQYLLPTLPFFGLFMIGMSAGRGSGRTLAPTIIGIFRLWVVRIGLGYFLSLSMGVMGIWISISLSNLLAGVAALIWLIYGNWNRPVIRRGEFEVSTT